MSIIVDHIEDTFRQPHLSSFLLSCFKKQSLKLNYFVDHCLSKGEYLPILY